jgi:excinuclease ABC subunit C
MAVMEDGTVRLTEYKRFHQHPHRTGQRRLRRQGEVLTRWPAAYLKEKEAPVAERKRRFSCPPELLLPDGGCGRSSTLSPRARKSSA